MNFSIFSCSSWLDVPKVRAALHAATSPLGDGKATVSYRFIRPVDRTIAFKTIVGQTIFTEAAPSLS